MVLFPARAGREGHSHPGQKYQPMTEAFFLCYTGSLIKYIESKAQEAREDFYLGPGNSN